MSDDGREREDDGTEIEKAQARTPRERLRRDLVIILGLALGLYVLFTLLSIASGRNFGGTVSALQTITFLSAVYAMVALALNLQWGYAGLLNLGVAGFMAIGVYVMALVSAPVDASIPGLGLPLVVGMTGGFLAAALVGALASLPALRLRADYLAIVTLAIGEIIRLTIRSRALAEFTVAGRTLGFGGTDARNLPPGPVRTLLYEEPDNLASAPNALGEQLFAVGDGVGLRSSVIEGWLYALLLVVVVAAFYWLLLRVSNSPFGRVLKAIREDELVASSLGKDVRGFKIKAFALGCGLMGLAGMFWWLQRGSVSPDTFDPELTFFVFVALIVGGAGSNTGSVVGGIVFATILFEGPNFIQRVLDANFDRGAPPDTFFDAFGGLEPFVNYFFSDVNISAFRLVVLGIILVYLMHNRPQGLFGHRTEVASSVDLSDRPSEGDR